MKDIEVYPIEDLIKELLRRSEDCLVLYSYEEKENQDDIKFDIVYKGDKEWLIKKIERTVIPNLQDDLDDEDEDEEEDE